MQCKTVLTLFLGLDNAGKTVRRKLATFELGRLNNPIM